MTTNLKWRLSKLPSVDELLKLINDKVITKEEAKEILFNEETVKEKEVESLKEEIKFLKEIIDKLSEKNITRTIEIVRTYPIPSHTPWYQPYYYATNQINNLLKGSTSNISNCSFSSLTSETVGNKLG